MKIVISVMLATNETDSASIVNEKIQMGRMGRGIDRYCQSMNFNEHDRQRFTQYALRCEMYEDAIRKIFEAMPTSILLIDGAVALTLAGENQRRFEAENIYYSSNLNAMIIEFYEDVPKFKHTI